MYLRVVADEGGVRAVAAEQLGPGGDIARPEDFPYPAQQRLVDLVAVVLEYLPFGPVAVDEIAPETNIVVELCRRQALRVEERTRRIRIVGICETNAELRPGCDGQRYCQQ
jgi:hypothetical protein